MDCCFLDLLGVPFKIHGRTKDGFDCYGLVLEVERRLGHELVDLKREYKCNNLRELNDNIYNILTTSKLQKTDELKYGNIVVFYDNKGRICHIGVLLDRKDFIHCDDDGVHISNLDKYYRKGEIYKWQE